MKGQEFRLRELYEGDVFEENGQYFIITRRVRGEQEIFPSEVEIAPVKPKASWGGMRTVWEDVPNGKKAVLSAKEKLNSSVNKVGRREK
ncbi:MAG: hypothetical protein A2Y57_04450 [Candidatus Woykebacteria bacterium RBG_13_40_7b]|uniref:Uncharacterized protein n=1 Tax=Candidatus Woykebacteria bacterium RBG_13_40_7b TaxID=1802594 RepID=A0A1G1W7U1_9BACT|nr:MAG: hypothetical protein A2Y57_04450 [Candidatus Woykebacteria bacterium RBG_13_40_7b]